MPDSPDAPPTLLTTKQVADLLQLAEITLKVWRRIGGGPPFLRIACGSGSRARVRYSTAALTTWLTARTTVVEVRTTKAPKGPVRVIVRQPGRRSAEWFVPAHVGKAA